MSDRFKIGDRVRVYTPDFCKEWQVYIAEVSSVDEKENRLKLLVAPNTFRYAHPKQCRRLKPKPKSVRVTMEMLAKAWDKHIARAPQSYFYCHNESPSFDELCKDLVL